MKNGYAILKACMEDQPDQVNALFALEMTQKVGSLYDRIQSHVGRAIGQGVAIDYDSIISESDGVAELANPDESPPSAKEADELVDMDGNPPLGSTSRTVKLPQVNLTGAAGVSY